ncbi:hypothetical protein ACJJJB_01610 [Microbulbifer sp. ANSA001]|uniref:hypothetical protein n=1 Tax=Microbulbifer TaxID=48073 RepID=UPI000364B600|nr:hypothetical protein [Microbulbifer variabilis]
MVSEGPVFSLGEYISEHKDDDCGTWENGHAPYIEYVLNQFNEQESKEFSEKIWMWSDFHLYMLADPILFCKNEYIDRYFLYSKIFGQVGDVEYLEYLAENLRAVILNSKMKNMDSDFLSRIKSNLVKIIETTDNPNWADAHNQLINLLMEEILKNDGEKACL